MMRAALKPGPKSALAAVLLASAIVSSCGKGAESPHVSASEAAGGEILPGTVSDAMIDLDGSRSQAPLAPRKANAKPTESASEKAVVQEVVQQADAPQAAATAAGDTTTETSGN